MSQVAEIEDPVVAARTQASTKVYHKPMETADGPQPKPECKVRRGGNFRIADRRALEPVYERCKRCDWDGGGRRE